MRNQRLVSSVGVIESIQVDWEAAEFAAVKIKHNTVNVEEKISRRVVTTGCGQGTVFGGLLGDIDKIHLSEAAKINQLGVYQVVDHIRTRPPIYKQAGSVHACAVSKNYGDHAEFLHFVEDVGRYNAVDSIVGLMWLKDSLGDDSTFYTTSWLTSEMVIKGA